MIRSGAMAAIALVLSLAGAMPILAQQPGPPGRFDYYLLTLSWSPAYCAAHGDAPSAAYQCRSGRALGFVEHGLWPQFEDGSWPYFCGQSHRLPHVLVEPMLKAIPSEALIQHEWQAHGSCTGPSAEVYLALAASAFDKVQAPPAAADWTRGATLTLAELMRDIMSVNPGLGPGMFAVECDRADRRHVQEIRYCLGKELGFRRCGARVVSDCDGEVSLEPVHLSGNTAKQP